MRHHRFLFSSVLCLALAASSAAAQDAQHMREARSLFHEGVDHLEAARFAEAVRALEASLEIRFSAPVLYNLGLAYRGTGAYGRAIEVLERFVTEADRRHARTKGEAEEIIEELRQGLVHLTLEIRGEPDEVLLDAEPLDVTGDTHSLVLDPGEHVVEVSRGGHEPIRRRVDLPPGAHETLVLDATARPRPARLVVQAAQEEAFILVDGREVGRGRGDLELDPGEYVLEVDAPGHGSRERIILLAPGAVERWNVDLPETPIWERWWLWTAVGAVAVGAVALAILLPRDGEVDDGSLGFTVEVLGGE